MSARMPGPCSHRTRRIMLRLLPFIQNYHDYKGAPHGLTDTHKQQLNEDLLAFIKA